MTRIVFHIGLAKTGTTAFQRFCHAHRRLLHQHGVLYPRRQRGRQHNHSPLVASYIAHRPEDFSVAMRWATRAEAVRSLRAEIDASGAHVALISSEHFSIHFDRSEARQLAQDFAAYDPVVVIALRDTHARFLSAYNTHVTAGGALTIADYASGTLIPGTRYMSIFETVRIWQSAFGPKRIRLIDYDAEADITAAILKHCDIEAPLPQTPRDRVSLDPAVVEQLRAANAIIRRRQTVPSDRNLAAWLQLSAFSILCRRRLVRAAAQRRETPRTAWSVDPAVLAQLDEIAARDRRWVRAKYGLALIGSKDRVRIASFAEPPATTAGQAEALVDRSVWGLEGPSRLLVTLWDKIAKGRLNDAG